MAASDTKNTVIDMIEEVASLVHTAGLDLSQGRSQNEGILNRLSNEERHPTYAADYDLASVAQDLCDAQAYLALALQKVEEALIVEETRVIEEKLG